MQNMNDDYISNAELQSMRRRAARTDSMYFIFDHVLIAAVCLLVGYAVGNLLPITLVERVF